MDASMRVAELPASRGAGWIGAAFRLFRAQPIAWMTLCIGWIVIWFGVLLVPILGLVASNVLQPVFFASFAIAAFRQRAGERLTMSELFSGFRRNLRPLVNLGFIMLATQLATVFLMRLAGLPSWPSDEPFDMVRYAEMLQENRVVVLGGMLFMSLVSGALWFAPQLIVFHDMTTSHAVRWSVYAALANVGAMVVYGLLLLVLLALAWIPFGLGLLVMLPVMVISTFTAYSEIFEGAAATPE